MTNYLIVLDKEENKEKQIILTSVNILSISEIDIDCSFVDCSFNFKCIHNKNIENIENLFMIQNCIELYSSELICSKIIGNDIQKVWNYKGKFNMYNNTEKIPYNIGYFYITMKLKSFFCHNINKFNIVNDESHREIEIYKSDIIIPINNCGEITYIWSYDLYSSEHVMKYMIIPTILTIMMQLVHRTKTESLADWIGIVSGFLLSDIALLFTIPETHSLILSEQVVYLNFYFKIALGMFAYYDADTYFGEYVFPGLGHHNIDLIICNTSLFSILFFIFQKLYSTFNHNHYVEKILKEKSKSKSIIWDNKNFIKYNNHKIINDYSYKQFLKYCWNYCHCSFCKYFDNFRCCRKYCNSD